MEPKGLLYVTLLYHEPSVSLQRLPSMRKNGVFGKDLETVTKQEGAACTNFIVFRLNRPVLKPTIYVHVRVPH
jgi:hypothetical protein